MKIYNVVVKEEAKSEISEAFFWYEDKQKDLGKRFLIALQNSFSVISKNPTIFAKKNKDMRHAMIRKFPYVAIYEIEDSDIVIYAVFHTSRNPISWKNR